jgi:hypothetical protein
LLKEIAKRGDLGNAVWVCTVSCWGFEKSADAVQHVLATVVASLEKHIDCLAIRGLPKSYANAVYGVSDWFGRLAGELTESEDDIAQLCSLARVLRAINGTLIVAIEDLDRNQSPRFSITEIEAMLHRIKLSVPEIRFLLTTGARTTISLSKLCDLIEPLPQLDEKTTYDNLCTFREDCFARYSSDLIPETVTSKTWRQRSDLDWLIRDSNDPQMEDAAVLLLRNPRVLKTVQTAVRRVWDRLHGEIDLDDLLIVTILRTAAPEVFDFFHRERRTLHGLDMVFGDKDQNKKRARLTRVRDELNMLEKEQGSSGDWNPFAVETLLVSLAPAVKDFSAPRGGKLQGVATSEPVDYWERLLREDLLDKEPRDQEVLKLINSWLRSQDQSFIHKLLTGDEPFNDRFKYFCGSIKPKAELLRLGKEMLAAAFSNGNDEAAYRCKSPLLSILSKSRQDIGVSDLLEWLKSVLMFSVGKNLYITNLLLMWVDSSDGIGDANGELKNVVQERSRQVFISNPGELRMALDRRTPDTLARIFTNSVERRLRPDEWTWMAEPLLNAAEIDPQLIAAHLAFVFVKHDGHDFQFDVDAVAKFFGVDQISRVADLFSAIRTAPTDNADEEKVLKDARDSAARWFQQANTASSARVSTPQSS